MTEQVYDRYYDTVGNYHWTGVCSGEHIERGGRMSSRYIDADKLKELFPDDGEGSWTYNVTAKSYIDSQPTADVVEVVRCKDCKWYVAQKMKCMLYEIHMVKNDYCSYGKRRENEQIHKHG